MVSITRIMTILGVCRAANGFVRPAIQSSPLFMTDRTVTTPNLLSRSLLQHTGSRLHLLSSENELTETPAAIGSSEGSGSVDATKPDAYTIAIRRTLAWVAAAAFFGTGLYLFVGPETSEEFFAGYLLELSLSVDNLLVFLLLFEYFKVPQASQNKILNWGIIGAVFMRAVMIGAGAVAIHEFHAILLGFAGILLYSSASVLFGGEGEEDEDLSDNPIIKFSNKFIQSTSVYDGDNFWTVQNEIRLATPMLLCTVAIELSDVVFAVDSVPAVFGVTENPLIVFSSNMFAILGLRSLYVILSRAAEDLEYLESAVAYILAFIGSKMIAEYFGVEVPTELSLGVVITLLSGGVGLSLLEEGKEERNENEE